MKEQPDIVKLLSVKEGNIILGGWEGIKIPAKF